MRRRDAYPLDAAARRPSHRKNEAKMKPKSITYDIGKDAYGRPVTLTFRRNYDGKELWAIRSEPIHQRDDGERMDGLTAENLRALAAAVST
jgi:hypothetical protein